MIWAAGGCLSEVDGVDYRKQFSNWWKNEMKTIKFPSKGTVFDYYVKESRLDEWASIVETIDYSSEVPMGEVTVPNTENVSMQTLMKALILVQQPVTESATALAVTTPFAQGCKPRQPRLYQF